MGSVVENVRLGDVDTWDSTALILIADMGSQNGIMLLNGKPQQG
jgi:hypothetical protein